MQTFKASLLQTAWFLLLHLYAPIAATVLNFFAVRKVGDEYYIAGDSETSTDSAGYYSLMPLAVICVILWIIGLPLIMSGAMALIRPSVLVANFRTDIRPPSSIRGHYSSDEHLTGRLRAFQFFFLSYKVNWFFWDIVLLLRRAVLLLVTRRWQGYYTGLRLLMGVLVSIGFLFMQFFSKPFLQTLLNKLESLSALCLVLMAVIYENVPVLDRLDGDDAPATNLAFRVIIGIFFLTWCLAFIIWVCLKVKKYVFGVESARQEKLELTAVGGCQMQSSLLADDKVGI